MDDMHGNIDDTFDSEKPDVLLNDATDSWDFNDFTEKRSSVHGKGLFNTVETSISEIAMIEQPLLEITAPKLDTKLNPPRAATDELLAQVADMDDDRVTSLINIMGTHTIRYINIKSLDQLDNILERPSGDESDLSDFESQLWAALYVQGSRLQGASGQETFQLFRNFRRLNHSCNPNAEAAWNSELGLLVVRATRDIHPGDEITITYLQNPFATRAERWEALRFKCRCEKCRLTGAELAVSEMDYKRYSEAFTKMQSFRNQWLGRHRRSDFYLSYELAEAICASAAREKIAEVIPTILDVQEYIERPRLSCISAAHQAGYLFYMSWWKSGRGGDQAHSCIKLAFGFLTAELELLGACLGFEHPKARAAFLSAWDMVETQLDEQDSVQTKGMLQEILDRKSWRYCPETREIERLGYWNEASNSKEALSPRVPRPTTPAPLKPAHLPMESIDSIALVNDSRPIIRPTEDQWMRSPLHDYGLFADRPLRPSQVIISEPPLLECSRPATHDGDRNPPDAGAFSHLCRLVRGMSHANMRALVTVAKRKPNIYTTMQSVEALQHQLAREDCGELMYTCAFARELLSLFRGTAVNFIDSKNYTKWRLFESFCMINHSCTPNAEVSWNPDTGRLVVRAVQDIETGDEVVVSYIDHLDVRSERRKALGFTCKCQRCDGLDARYTGREEEYLVLSEAVTALEGIKQAYEGDADLARAKVSAFLANKKLFEDAREVMKIADKCRLSLGLANVSKLAIIPYMKYLRPMCRYLDRGPQEELSTAHKAIQKEVRLLAVCLGIEHPKAQIVVRRAFKLEAELVARRAGIPWMPNLLAKYGWAYDLQADELRRVECVRMEKELPMRHVDPAEIKQREVTIRTAVEQRQVTEQGLGAGWHERIIAMQMPDLVKEDMEEQPAKHH